MKAIKIILTIHVFSALLGGFVFGQQVLIDQGVRTEGLWCFPSYGDSTAWYYLPYEARLALDETQHPQFSFMRYIINKPKQGGSGNSIQDADGGAILHFLVLYDTPGEIRQDAEEELRDMMGNRNINLKGPVIFNEGTFSLVSSILNPADGSEERKLLAQGKAPIFEGNRIALSFDMDPTASKLLLESFKMKTPDVSLIFDMSFSGLSESYDAKLEVDWSKVYESESLNAGGRFYFLSAEVEKGLDDLRQQQAIKLTTNGSNEASDALIRTVYDKLVEMMFTPVPASSVENQKSGGMESMLASTLNPRNFGKNASFFPISLSAGYKLKEMRSRGKTVMDFSGRSETRRHYFITFNAGGLYQKYGKDSTVFKDVPLYDPAFQQREIFVSVDGTLEKEFDKMLNSVTVTLRKKHQAGTETIQEVIVKRDMFKDYQGPLSMIYGSQGDLNRTEWMNFEFKTDWRFQGGSGYKTEWQTEDASMINLYTPYRYHQIELGGDMQNLAKQGVRAVVVQIQYPFFDQVKSERLIVRPGDDLFEKKFSLTLPNDQQDVAYEISWIKDGGQKVQQSGKDSYGLIFIDELPVNR